jgi:hypothetical protein
MIRNDDSRKAIKRAHKIGYSIKHCLRFFASLFMHFCMVLRVLKGAEPSQF